MAKLNDECEMELTPTDNVEFFMGEDIYPHAVRYRQYIRRAYEAATLERVRKEEVSPPAPPSTPTMLTPTSISNGIGDFVLNGNGNGNTNGIFINSGSSSSSSTSSTNTTCTRSYDYLKERVNNILHILDFSPSHKSTNHAQTQGTDAELSDLFNDVSINGTIPKSHRHYGRITSLTKVQGELGISTLSRSIRKHKLPSINAALQSQTLGQPDSLLQCDDEDTASAPECVEENFRRKRRLNRLRLLKRFIKTKRQQERMDSMVNMFHGGLNFKDA